MALTKNREVDHYIDQELRSFQVAAAANVFKGSLVGVTAAGYARPLVAGDPFVGIAYEEMDNTAGVDGDESVRAYTLGDFGVTLAGATLASLGRPVFASSDDTLTFTGVGNSYVGIVQDVVTTGEIILRIDPERAKLKTVTYAVEDLAAGADISATAIHVFDVGAWLVSARVVNQATTAAGIDNTNTCLVALATDAGSIVAATFDATLLFPAANTKLDLGTLTNAHVQPGYVMMLVVVNGVTANPGPFLVEIDYV